MLGFECIRIFSPERHDGLPVMSMGILGSWRVSLAYVLDCVEILVQNLVHGEHVHAVLLEHGAQGVVAPDLALVAGIL